MPETSSLFPFRCRTGLLLGTIFFVLTSILFWPAVRCDLVNLDDIVYVTENQMIRDGLSWHAIREAFTSLYQVMWAPGLWISYMVDIDLFGISPWGFHFTNVLLHSINALLVFILFWQWTRKPWCAFWAAALWAWHPLRVESVAWVAARKDVLSGFFFLACLLFYGLAHAPPSPATSSTGRSWPRRVSA